MPKHEATNYTDILESFLKEYQVICDQYIQSHESSFARDYFCNWYQSEGLCKLMKIRKQLNPSMLDERISRFVNLYERYIHAAQSQGDEDLLLENLFAVPEQMEREFTKFGFLHAEAAASENNTVVTGFELFDIAGKLLTGDVCIKSNSLSFENNLESGFKTGLLFV